MILSEQWVDLNVTLRNDGPIVLLAQLGSRAYGTHREDSDYDFKGVYVAPNQSMFSLRGPMRTYTRSDPHDTTIYELAHFVKLAADGNPTILEILWSDVVITDSVGEKLRLSRSLFLSKRLAETYAGYAMSQAKKAADYKAKLHTLRLLACGIHALRHGEVMVHLSDPLVAGLKRDAQLTTSEFQDLVAARVATLEQAAADSALPELPDVDAIDRLVYSLRTTDQG